MRPRRDAYLIVCISNTGSPCVVEAEHVDLRPQERCTIWFLTRRLLGTFLESDLVTIESSNALVAVYVGFPAHSRLSSRLAPRLDTRSNTNGILLRGLKGWTLTSTMKRPTTSPFRCSEKLRSLETANSGAWLEARKIRTGSQDAARRNPQLVAYNVSSMSKINVSTASSDLHTLLLSKTDKGPDLKLFMMVTVRAAFRQNYKDR